jgi:hypothetical protein
MAFSVIAAGEIGVIGTTKKVNQLRWIVRYRRLRPITLAALEKDAIDFWNTDSAIARRPPT